MAKETHVYAGGEITVRFDSARCIHAGECVRGLPLVFDPKRRPWVDPNAASAEEIAAVVARCPTGALHCEALGDRMGEPVPDENTVSVTADGALYVRGDVALHRAEDAPAVHETRVALCRCGASRNKPFCDGSHAEAGFRDSGDVSGQARTREAAPAGSALVIAVRRNGPLLCVGPMTIQDSHGKVVFRGNETALCRCGASKEKPFCDGSHRKVDFVAD